jgi:hypothetical protein
MRTTIAKRTMTALCGVLLTKAALVKDPAGRFFVV